MHSFYVVLLKKKFSSYTLNCVFFHFFLLEFSQRQISVTQRLNLPWIYFLPEEL